MTILQDNVKAESFIFCFLTYFALFWFITRRFITRHLGSKKNFSEFAKYVNGLKPESLKDVDNGGLHIGDLNAIDNDN